MGLLRATGEFIGVCKKREPAVDLDTVADAAVSEISFEDIAEASMQEAVFAVPMMPVPQKVGLIEPKIFDPQVHLEILTELFGVYKGCEYTHTWECQDCDHQWDTKSNTSGWDYDEVGECPNCDSDDVCHEDWEGGIQTSRTPTHDELECVAPFTPHWGRLGRLTAYFSMLHGHEAAPYSPETLDGITLLPLPKPEPVMEDDELDFDELPNDEDFF